MQSCANITINSSFGMRLPEHQVEMDVSGTAFCEPGCAAIHVGMTEAADGQNPRERWCWLEGIPPIHPLAGERNLMTHFVVKFAVSFLVCGFAALSFLDHLKLFRISHFEFVYAPTAGTLHREIH